MSAGNRNIALPPPAAYAGLVRSSLQEDADAAGDITARAVVPEEASATCRIVAREPGTIAGGFLADAFAAELNNGFAVRDRCLEGARVDAGDSIMALGGNARTLLRAERPLLNFLGLLSGIATQAVRFAEAVAGTGAKVLDTRKTLPGFRLLEKYAVSVGGAHNHRMGLFDQVMLKENHFRASGLSFADTVRAARRAMGPSVPVIVESTTLDEARRATRAGADIVVLDNFALGDLRRATAVLREEFAGRCPLIEASGGITLDNVRSVAECGVDRISVGALTHSVQPLDLSALFEA